MSAPAFPASLAAIFFGRLANLMRRRRLARRAPRRRLAFQPLESRILLSADPAAAAALYVVDGSIAGELTPPPGETLVLDRGRDGLEQIARALAERPGQVSELHILSHGASGSLALGSTTLDASSLASHEAQLRAWADALTADADILLYGCSVAEGEAGASFVDELARLTGADIAASTDLTGSAALGGDWDLEYAVDAIEAGAFACAASDLLLGTVSYNAGTDTLAFTADAGETDEVVIETLAPGVLRIGVSLDDAITLIDNAAGNPAFELTPDREFVTIDLAAAPVASLSVHLGDADDALTFGLAHATGIAAIELTAESIAITSNITTLRDQSYNGALTLGASTVFASTGSVGTLSFSGSLAAGVHTVFMSAREINLPAVSNSVSGSGMLILQPEADATPVNVGGAADAGASSLDITTSDIAALAGGFSQIIIGRTVGTAPLVVTGAASFGDAVTLRASGIGGFITVDARLSTTADGDAGTITLVGTGATTTLNADIVTAGAAIQVFDAVKLGSAALITLDTTNGGAVAAGADITFDSPGSVDDNTANTSSLRLEAGATGAVTLDTFGTSSAAAGLTVNAATFSARTLRIAGGFATLNATADVQTLNLSSGTLSGTGIVTLTGAASAWTGGTYTGSGQLVVPAGHTLTIGGGATKSFGSGRLVNEGTVLWSGGHIDIVGGGSIVNRGLFDVQLSATIGDQSAGVGTLTFNNEATGILRKSAGTGVTAFGSSGGATPNGVNFSNAGLVDVQTGVLSINHSFSGLPVGTGTSSGRFSVAEGAALRFGGSHTLTESAQVSGAGEVSVEHGSFSMAGAWGHAGALAVRGVFTQASFLSAVMAPSMVTIATGVNGQSIFNGAVTTALTVSSGTATFNGPVMASGFVLSGGTLNGPGQITLDNGGLWSGGSYTGTGELIVPIGRTLTMDTGGASLKRFGSGTLVNDGTLLWIGGGIDIVGSGTIQNRGQFELQADNATLGDLSTGIGTLTLVNEAEAMLRKGTGGGLVAIGSSGGGTPNGVNLHNTGTVEVTAGTLSFNRSITGLPSGAGTSSGEFVVGSEAQLHFGGANTLTATSTVSGPGAVFMQHGTFSAAGAWGNTGALHVNGGAATFAPFSGAMAPSSVEVAGGVAVFDRAVMAGGLTISSGVATFNASTTTAALALSDGTLNGSGRIALQGTGSWTGGTYTGTGELVVEADQLLGINRGTGVLKRFGTGTLVNEGTVAWTFGAIDVVGNGTIINRGLFDARADATFGDQSASVGRLTFENEAGAVLRKGGGAGTTVIGSSGGSTPNGVDLTNAGTLEVLVGTLSINQSFSGSVPGFLASSGTIFVGAGATLQRTGGFTSTGILSGTGTIDVGAGNTLISNGTVAPGVVAGDTTGTLRIAGNYAQGSTGQLVIELASVVAGDFDVLEVSGTAVLAAEGTLKAELLPGSMPASNDRFRFMTFASRTGLFASDLPADFYLDATDATDLELVYDPNDPPVAVDDSATTDEDLAVTIAVLANDTDIDGDALQISGFSQGASGAVSLNADGTLAYTPDLNFHGTDTFEYTISDGTLTDTAIVTVTVLPVNDAPVALDDEAMTDEDHAVSGNVLRFDFDVDVGDTRLVGAVNGEAANVGATITLRSGALLTLEAGGFFTYDPNGAFESLTGVQLATDSFTYAAVDSQGAISNTATVTITLFGVNDAPVAVDDSNTTDEDHAVGGDVLANDTDVEGDTLAVSAVNGQGAGVGSPVVLASGAQLTVNTDGSYSYDPDGAFEFLGVGESALDSFTYVASDSQGGSDTATVTLTVSGVNDAPVAIDDEALTDEDHAVSGNVLRHDFDADLTDTRLVGAVNGQAANVGATITLGSGALLALEAGGFFTYDPNGAFEFLRAGQVAADSFTYVAVDSQGALSNTATVTVTLVGNNDAPVATDDSVTTDEDVAILIDVLANDTDVEGDTLNVSGFTQGANGTVAFAGGVLSYTPTANFHGIDSFEYTVSDGVGGSATGLVTVTINSVNDAPVATDDSATTDEDLPVLIEVLANDADVDGDTLAIASFTDGANGTVVQDGNELRYSPNLNFNGSDSFTYTVSDGAGGTDTALVTISISAVNDAPVATDDGATTAEDVPVTIDVLVNDADVDGDALVIGSFSDGTNGMVVQVGSELRYTPNLNFHGTDTFSYTVSDGAGGSDMAVVTVTVESVNDAPVLAPIGNQAVTEGSLLTFAATATDVDGDGLAFSVEGAPVGAAIDAFTGVFTWTPMSSQGPGSYAVTVRVTDDGTPSLDDFQTFTILVNDVGGEGVDLLGTVAWDPADLLIQGDLEEAIVLVSNVGDAAAGEAVQVTLYASADGILDASDTVLATAQTSGGLAAGTSEVVSFSFQLTIGLLPGDYVLLAQVDSADQVAEADETNNVSAGAEFDFHWMFGAVPGHGQVTLLVDDADGTHALFALIGPGTGEITVDQAGEWDMIINGTRWYSIATVLTLGGGDQRIALGDIHVTGALGALIAPTTDLTGTLAIDGTVTFGIVIGSATQATITAPEILGWGLLGPGIQGIAVFGDLEDSQIVISEGDLGHLLVTGSMLSSEVSVEQGDIDSITILGEMSADSSIAAEDLPRYAWVDGVRTATAGDPRFEEVSVDWSARWAGAMACLPFGRPGANFSDFARYTATEAGRIRR